MNANYHIHVGHTYTCTCMYEQTHAREQIKQNISLDSNHIVEGTRVAEEKLAQKRKDPVKEGGGILVLLYALQQGIPVFL